METKNEIWKDVKGYEGLYKVSNLGRVMSLKCGKIKILNPKPKPNQYKIVSLRNNGKETHISIHRLVAMSFVPGYAPTLVVNHKDRDIHNNSADNLEWVTSSYNTNYDNAHEKGRNKARETAFKRSDAMRSHIDDIKQIAIKLREQRVKIGLSQKKLADKLEVCDHIVSAFERFEYNAQIAFVVAYADIVGMKLDLIIKNEK